MDSLSKFKDRLLHSVGAIKTKFENRKLKQQEKVVEKAEKNRKKKKERNSCLFWCLGFDDVKSDDDGSLYFYPENAKKESKNNVDDELIDESKQKQPQSSSPNGEESTDDGAPPVILISDLNIDNLLPFEGGDDTNAGMGVTSTEVTSSLTKPTFPAVEKPKDQCDQQQSTDDSDENINSSSDEHFTNCLSSPLMFYTQSTIREDSAIDDYYSICEEEPNAIPQMDSTDTDDSVPPVEHNQEMTNPIQTTYKSLGANEMFEFAIDGKKPNEKTRDCRLKLEAQIEAEKLAEQNASAAAYTFALILSTLEQFLVELPEESSRERNMIAEFLSVQSQMSLNGRIQIGQDLYEIVMLSFIQPRRDLWHSKQYNVDKEQQYEDPPPSPFDTDNPPRVYFETQRQLFCGMHAINNILQGPVFNRRQMFSFAHQVQKIVDECENITWGRKRSADSQMFTSDGYFNIAVLENALASLDTGPIQLVPWYHPDQAEGRSNPAESQSAFLINKSNVH